VYQILSQGYEQIEKYLLKSKSCESLPAVRRNLVLEELSDKKLDVIQEVICVRAFWR